MNQSANYNLLREPWGEFTLAEEAIRTWSIGPLQFWFRLVSGELWVASKTARHGIDEWKEEPIRRELSPNPPEDAPWTRWVLNQTSPKIRLIPAFPDLPVIVKPEYSFNLMTNTEARIYVRVPLWVRIQLVTDPPLMVKEIPIVTLSQTWFGDYTSGELCYWLATTARRKVGPDLFRPFLAVCPIHIHNVSGEMLKVDKVCLRVIYLSLFHLEGQFWSDETKIIHKGKDNDTQLEFIGVAPPEAPQAMMVSGARMDMRKKYLGKTFASFMDI